MAKLLVQLPSVLSVTLTSDNDPFPKETINSNPNLSKEKSGGSWSTIQCFLSIKKTSNMDFVECRHINQYGILQRRTIGTGTTAAVKLTRRIDSNGKMQTYAVKAFRKKKVRESDKSFMKKLISEFCIASTLDHPNIVQTLDLVKDKKGRYCTIMEYCSGGDLYTFIKQGNLCPKKTNIYFRQLLEGLSYLHNLGVAHRDIKPENLLLAYPNESDQQELMKGGNERCRLPILKISDFGEADVYREAWQKSDANSRLSDGLCGSTPYIAPEIFMNYKKGYHASQADVWSAGIVYFCMRLNGVPFYSAQQSDSNFRLFKKHFSAKTYPAFQVLDDQSRSMIYTMLDPNPIKRWSVDNILKLTWIADL